MSLIASLVSIYRFLETPIIEKDASFSVSGIKLTAQLIQEIKNVWNSPDAKMVELEVICGIDRLDSNSDFECLKKKTDTTAHKVTIKLPRQGEHQFYNNIVDFLARNNSQNSGALPQTFYLIEDDYLHSGTSEHKKPEAIKKLEHFCELINLLKKASHFFDTSSTFPSAVFMINEEGAKDNYSKIIKFYMNESLLGQEMVDIKFLKEITDVNDSSTHREERLSTFRVSLANILAKSQSNESDLLTLVKNWGELKSTYLATYELYIRGFSFSKFISDITDYVHETIQKANNLLGDIVIKTLAVPSLFAVWLLVLRSNSVDSIFAIGLCATLTFSSVLVIFVIDNQQFLVKQLQKSAGNTLDNFMSNQANESNASFNIDILTLLENSNNMLKKRLKNISNRLLAIRLFIWLFILTSLVITVESTWIYSQSTISVIYIPMVICAVFCYVIERLVFNKK
jgi:hypothetical protein